MTKGGTAQVVSCLPQMNPIFALRIKTRCDDGPGVSLLDPIKKLVIANRPSHSVNDDVFENINLSFPLHPDLLVTEGKGKPQTRDFYEFSNNRFKPRKDGCSIDSKNNLDFLQTDARFYLEQGKMASLCPT